MADKLPVYQSVPQSVALRSSTAPLHGRLRHLFIIAPGIAALYLIASFSIFSGCHDHGSTNAHHVPLHAQRVLAECASIKEHLGPLPYSLAASNPKDFNLEPLHNTSIMLQYGPAIKMEPKVMLLTNRHQNTITHSAGLVVRGDILLQGGLIKAVGKVPKHLVKEVGKHLEHVDASGAWVTPGIFDLHSHLGVYSMPALRGSSDGNSIHGLTSPWLRSLDGINVYDEALRLTVPGGVIASFILPGSANTIGGQAIVIKLRPTTEGSPSSMVLEPPFALNGTDPGNPSIGGI